MCQGLYWVPGYTGTRTLSLFSGSSQAHGTGEKAVEIGRDKQPKELEFVVTFAIRELWMVSCGSQTWLSFSAVQLPVHAEPSTHVVWFRKVYCEREPEPCVLGKGSLWSKGQDQEDWSWGRGWFAARQSGQTSRGLMDYIPPVRNHQKPHRAGLLWLQSFADVSSCKGKKSVSDLSVTFLSSCFPKCDKIQTQIICTKLVNFSKVVE